MEIGLDDVLCDYPPQHLDLLGRSAENVTFSIHLSAEVVLVNYITLLTN